jgi:hypothetical protein
MMKYKAVIDRFEGDLAVLLVEDNKQFTLPVSRTILPLNIKAGDHLQITLINGLLTKATLDEEATKASQSAIDQEMTNLRRRSKGADKLNS